MDTTIMELELVALAYLQDSHLARIHLQSPQAGWLAPSLPPTLPPIGAEPIGLCTIKSGENIITCSATLIGMEEPGQIRKSFSVATYEWA
jgi:hypothetical protein